MRAFMIQMSDVARCPIRSLSVAHYNNDGTCRCQKEEAMTEPQTWTSDHRWSPGASGATVPKPGVGASAAYSARWIDQGTGRAGDIVWDRQGFAYSAEADRDELIARLQTAGPADMLAARDTPRDQTDHLIDDPRLQVFIRRAGGYYYVDAWTPL